MNNNNATVSSVLTESVSPELTEAQQIINLNFLYILRLKLATCWILSLQLSIYCRKSEKTLDFRQIFIAISETVWYYI